MMRRRTGTADGDNMSSSSRWPMRSDPANTCDNKQRTTLIENVSLLFTESSLVATPVALIHRSLAGLGVAEEDLPTPIALFRVVLALLAVVLMLCYFSWGRQKSRKSDLQRELQLARAKVRSLQDQLKQLKDDDDNNNKKQQPLDDTTNGDKEIRIFMDGAFDLLHYGHMNAFRLAKSLGTTLIVGVNSDESITRCKGAPPLMSDDERMTMVKTCKFVDEVVENCPYVMSPEYLDWVIKEKRIDYVIHGSDPCFTVDGEDVYAAAKATGKFRMIPRTEGVSTSDILGRILVMTREHHIYDQQKQITADKTEDENNSNKDEEKSAEQQEQQEQPRSKFLTTSLLLKLFSAGVKAPKKGMKVIYIDGTWDLFHPGHVAILKAARERGDYLIVGVHGDAVVNRLRGMNMPLMNLHERVLSVLGCRYVDDVLIDAPYEITPDMVDRLNISEVVKGTKHDDIGVRYAVNMYDYPKRAGILTEVESPSTFNMEHIVQRIRKNQKTFEEKFDRKIKMENEFYKNLRSTSQ
ncbi:Ethanolamine-phosphate cytidylyltransferase [Seminavis robusta]|uniref:ethanolamine-phosphate cytidylyltransferase n=1 Tax=Seminavis robusta TaxID=568900 RepID=A0A9N8DNY7_9STRA|nr:Ethanolamine-phosphate cytidylyltransferase [Seminavis robusta]|eukprot:Sro253_g100000.1 Ethanolamine-phosphate cytidylyltransferase (523) ;mRNA; r:68538-70211